MKSLIAIATLLEEANIATKGIDLFIGTIPADVDRGIMLRDPLAGVDIDMDGFYSTGFHVIVRDPDVMAGYAKAEQIQAYLSGLGVTKVGDVTISWLIPETLPISYPRGDADDIETSFRMRIGFGID